MASRCCARPTRSRKPLKGIGRRKQQAGVAIVRRACDEPCRQIAENAGQGPVGHHRRGSASARARTGTTPRADKFENLMAAGVVDPTMVVRLALQNAASIAGLLLSSEALIADAPRDPVDYPESGSAA